MRTTSEICPIRVISLKDTTHYLKPGMKIPVIMMIMSMIMMIAWMLISLLCSVCTVFVKLAFSSHHHTDIWSNVMMINVWIFSARPTFLNLNLNLNSLRLQPAGPKRRFFSLSVCILYALLLLIMLCVCVSILVSFCHLWLHIMSPSFCQLTWNKSGRVSSFEVNIYITNSFFVIFCTLFVSVFFFIAYVHRVIKKKIIDTQYLHRNNRISCHGTKKMAV